MNGYKMYLIDYDGTSIELDTEDLDFGLELKISSLQDLSLRAGNRTKDIVLKGTSINNEAFGHIYRLGRTNDTSISNKLFFNYNSLRPVDCLIYKDSYLIFRGNFRLIEVLRNKGVMYYSCVITDGVIDLIKYTKDRLLTDIDFIDLTHNYGITTITQSWSQQTERITATGYSYTPFQLGSGYVYGYGYYGYTYSGTLNGTVSTSLYDYRPAIYGREMLNRIFTQPGLTGFSYEIYGDTLNERIDAIVLPNLQEKMSSKISGFQMELYRSPTQSGYTSFGLHETFPDPEYGGEYTNFWWEYLNLQNYSFTGSNAYLATFNKITDYTWQVINDITLDARIEIAYTVFVDSTTTWRIRSKDIIETVEFVIGATGTTFSGNITLNIPTTLYSHGELIQIESRHWKPDYDVANSFSNFNLTASYTLPDVATDTHITAVLNTPLTPSPPEKVSQYDFIKSLMIMYDMYAYVEKDRPKHIIFKTYDDFYVLTLPQYIISTALDWTNKIVYSEDWKNKRNLTIPKRYTYTYKEDKDWLNDKYKKRYNSVYGELRFTDAYGVTDEKKVEVLFSPSPQVSTDGKKYPMFRGGDDIEQKPTALNTRILYYNGVRGCDSYRILNTISYPDFINNIDVYPIISTQSSYGEMSEYYNPDNLELPIESLQWGTPRELYFTATDDYFNIPNLYSYYTNQVTELTNSNLYVLECMVYLSSIDISRFDFKTPIFISTDIGNSYFKVLEIKWDGSHKPASVILQSIFFGNER